MRVESAFSYFLDRLNSIKAPFLIIFMHTCNSHLFIVSVKLLLINSAIDFQVIPYDNYADLKFNRDLLFGFI